MNDSAADLLAASNADVYDALEGKRKSVCSMFIIYSWVERGLGFGWTSRWWEKTINDGGVLWGRRGKTKVLQEFDKTFKAAIHSHDFTDPRRG